MKFENELKLIKSEYIRLNTAKAIVDIPEEFFKAPASSTGKYHPEYCLGEGGLYRHTRAAVAIAQELFQMECYGGLWSDDEKDYIIAALILHDTRKSGDPWERHTRNDHPLLAARALWADRTLGTVFCQNVTNLIASHMGQWNKIQDDLYLPKPKIKAEQFVHLCDYLASRKIIEVKLAPEEE